MGFINFLSLEVIFGYFWPFWAVFGPPPVWGSGFGSYLSPLFSLGAPDIRLTIPKSPKKSDPKHSAIRHHSNVNVPYVIIFHDAIIK